MNIIQSVKNDQVKRWKKLLTKKERDKTGLFIVEGEHLVNEAYDFKQLVELIVTESYFAKMPKRKYRNVQLFVVANEIGRVISDTETPQGIFAVCRQQEKQQEVKGSQFLLIDAVQDPGNLGTMLRTADGVGCDVAILGEGCVDLYNPKVVRAAQGSHFHFPIIHGNLKEWIQKLRKQSIPIYGTALVNGRSMYSVEPSQSFAVIVGNEGQGVNEELLKLTDRNLYIPIFGKSESLNVSIATGILLYYLKGKD